MTLIKNFSDFLIEKSLNEEEVEDAKWPFPLEYKSIVTDKDRSISEESFMKVIDLLDAKKEEDLVSGEWEILYQFAKKISDRKDSEIEKGLGVISKGEGDDWKAYNEVISNIREANKKFRSIFEETIGEKSIKDFSKDGGKRLGIIDFYDKISSDYKEGNNFYSSVKSLYGETEANEIKDGENIIGKIIPKMIGVSSSISKEKNLELKAQYLTGKEGDEAKDAASKEAAKDMGKITRGKIRVILKRISYCFTSSYGCLSQINSMTYIDSGVDRAEKDELLGKFSDDGTQEKEGSIYTSITALNEKIIKLIGEEGKKEEEEIEIPKSEFKEGDETLKSKIYDIRDKIKELQEVSDNGEMTQEQWEDYVKDKKRPGFRYQDLKDAFGLLQSAVENYCTGENSSNALDLYYKTLEDYITGEE